MIERSIEGLRELVRDQGMWEMRDSNGESSVMGWDYERAAQASRGGQEMCDRQESLRDRGNMMQPLLAISRSGEDEQN